MSSQELVKRLAVSVVGMPVALFLVYLGGWPLTVTLTVVAALGAREFYRLGSGAGILAFSGIGVPVAAGMVLLAGAARSFEAFAPGAFALTLGVLMLSAVAAIWLRWPSGRPLSSVPFTVAGILYTGGLLSSAVFLRHLPDAGMGFDPDQRLEGPFLLGLPLVVTWTADSSAYFFGHLLGNKKLIPAVSPGKTVAGSVGGLISSMLMGGVLCWLFLSLHPNPLVSSLIGGVIGLLLGAAAQLGDLVESVLKREAGFKDSGTFFPGHGGILDRFDALLFTLPVAYALVRLVWALQ